MQAAQVRRLEVGAEVRREIAVAAAALEILDQRTLPVNIGLFVRRSRRYQRGEFLPRARLPMPAEEVDEARQFLQWLDSGNFIFLGYRRYGFETREGKDYLPPQPDSGLGILREVCREYRDQPRLQAVA